MENNDEGGTPQTASEEGGRKLIPESDLIAFKSGAERRLADALKARDEADKRLADFESDKAEVNRFKTERESLELQLKEERERTSKQDERLANAQKEILLNKYGLPSEVVEGKTLAQLMDLDETFGKIITKSAEAGVTPKSSNQSNNFDSGSGGGGSGPERTGIDRVMGAQR